MNKIEHKGNLPPMLQIFAKQLGGVYAQVKNTEFYEASSIQELEAKASEIGYEIIPTLDSETNRAFLVGFDAEDTVIVGADGQEYSRMIMYFIEITPEQLKSWDKKIKEHRIDQMVDMYRRQELRTQAHKKVLKPIK